MTEVAVLTVPALTVNVADVAPGATVTLAGTLAAAAFELESDTTTLEGKAAVKVTVPVPDCPLTPRIVKGTATLLSATDGGSGFMVTFAVLLTPE